MSAIALPRLYFRGHTWWNPSTFNNNDNLPTYDAAHVRLNTPYLYEQGVYSPAQFERWAITTTYDPTQDEYLPPAEWNYYGDMTCGFVSPTEPRIEDPAHFDRPAGGTTITGWTDPEGTHAATGPWATAQLATNPGGVSMKMCDVSPAGFWSTQLFADHLQVGDPAGVGFKGALAHRMCSRFPNLQNNFDHTQQLLIAGSMNVIWQACLPRRDLELFGDLATPGPGKQLAAALERPEVAGLMVRFSSWETLYFNGPEFRALTGSKGERLSARMALMADLYQQFAAARAAWARGEAVEAPPRPINRAFSKTMGWIAPWLQGELCSAPGGRLLIAGATLTGETPRAVAPRPVDGAALDPLPLGPALVEAEIVDGAVKRIALDTAVTLPKIALDGPVADYGVLALQLGGRTIASLSADRYADASTAGLFDLLPSVALSADDWFGADLSLVAFADATPAEVLAEQALTARTDQRGAYVEEPGVGPFARPDTTVTVRVQHRGRAPEAGTRLLIAQYDAGWAQIGGDGQSPIVRLVADPALHPKPAGDGGLIVDVTPGAGDWGEATVALRGLRPGIPNLAFAPFGPGAAPPTVVASVGGTAVVDVQYTVARVLPFHDALATEFAEWLRTAPDVDQVNARVFQDVFAVWLHLFPVMDFLRDPLVFQSWRGPIMDVTDPARFCESAYMPVNRAFSAGQRRILELWDAYLNARPVDRAPGLKKRSAR